MLTASGSTSSQSAKRTLAPAPGVTPAPTDGSSYRFLSDVIIARGLVEPAAMKAALQASLAGRSLTEILVDNGELSEDDLARTLAEHHRLDFVDLDVFAVDPRATALIEPDVARRFGAVPIALLDSGAVVVALYDPNGSTAVLEFARLTDRVIQPAVASRKQIEALISTLRRGGVRPPHTPALPEPPAPTTPSPEHHLRSVAREVHIPVSSHADDVTRSHPPALGPPPRSDSRPVPDPRVDDLRERAETAERQRHEATERARAAEQRLQAAEDRARGAEELTRLAEARARVSEERAAAAGERVDAAEARADGMSSAVDAANETLERLVHACEVLEHEAKARGPELEVLRTALDAERSERTQLEAEHRHPQPSEDLLALNVRIAELERELRQQQAAGAAAARPAPPSPPSPAAPHAYAPAPPAPAAEPPQAYAPAHAPEPPAAAEPQPEVDGEAYVAPSIAPTIDIMGEPGVPYVSALAPMPSTDEPLVKKAPKKNDSSKARGLRRLISAIKRSA